MDGIGIGSNGPFGLKKQNTARKVVFCVPTLLMPHPEFIEALEASCPLLDQEGIDHGIVFELGCPYISGARATMLRKALDHKAEIIVFLDDDVSWDPPDLVKLINTKGDVVAGTYRFKGHQEEYMGLLLDGPDHRPVVREDGCVKAELVPAGFLKITIEAVDKFMRGYPELVYGSAYSPHVDLFNHGARGGRWWGEDYSFSNRWREIGGELWIVPDLHIHHHYKDHAWKGNFHEFLLRQPGGSKHVKTQFDCEVEYGTAARGGKKPSKKAGNARTRRMAKTGNSRHKSRPQPGRIA